MVLWCVGVGTTVNRSAVFTVLPSFDDRGRLWKGGGWRTGCKLCSVARVVSLSYTCLLFSSLLLSYCRLVVSYAAG